MNNLIGFTLFIFGAFLNSIAQILIKKSVMDSEAIYKYFNKRLILSGLIFLLVILISITGYKFIDLKYGIVLSSSTYIFIVTLSKYILKEDINKKVFQGVLFILLGIIIFYIN